MHVCVCFINSRFTAHCILFSLAQSCRRLVRVCRHGHVQLANVVCFGRLTLAKSSLILFLQHSLNCVRFCSILLPHRLRLSEKKMWRKKNRVKRNSCRVMCVTACSLTIENANSIQNETEFNSNARCIETNAVHSENRSSNKSSVHDE